MATPEYALRKLPRPEILTREVPRPLRARWLSWVATTDHKRIGIMYMVAAFVFFMVGGTEALLMRAGAIAGNDPAFFNLVGILREVEGNKDGAAEFYGRAIRSNSEYAPAQQNMRRLYELKKFGQTDQAVLLGDEA